MGMLVMAAAPETSVPSGAGEASQDAPTSSGAPRSFRKTVSPRLNPPVAPRSPVLPAPLTVFLSPPPDVHPDHHPDRLPQPVCLRVSGNALHAQSLRHPLPPRAERSQAETELQGENSDPTSNGRTGAEATGGW